MRDYLKTLRIEKNFSQQEVADKLGVSLSYYNLIENGERQKDISFSIGVSKHQEGMESGELLRCADKALYVAKRSGKDRFHFYS